MFRPSAHDRWNLRALLAAWLFYAGTANVFGQPPTYGQGGMPNSAVGAPPAAAPPQQPAPALFAAQSSGYPQFAPGSQNNGFGPYPSQPSLNAQPPGYEQVPSPLPNNGAPGFAPPPNGRPPYPYLPPMPFPGGPNPVPASARPELPPLPDMVYLVTSKFWFRPEVLLWWTRAEPITQPIATAGSLSDSVPGAVGQPGTQTLIGGGNSSFGFVGGVRLETGMWLDERHTLGIEAGYFVLIQQSKEVSDASDSYGNPVMARPVISAKTGAAGVYYDALPGQIIGSVEMQQRSEFQGANLDGNFNLIQTQTVRLDGLVGFRYLSLVESMNVYDETTNFFNGGSSFGGSPIGAGDILSDFDGFRVTNSFYGGSTGARLYYAQGRWFLSALGKVAMGTLQERATLSGSTTLFDQSGHQTMLPGGILVTSANMGHYYQTKYAVAPEWQLNFGYQITPSVTLRAGYSFIYLNNVARPGEQVNLTTSTNRVPSDPSYGTSGPNPPAFQFHTSTYWAQGLNLGIDSRF